MATGPTQRSGATARSRTASASSRCSTGSTCGVAAGRGRRPRRALGLRQVDAARARSPASPSRTDGPIAVDGRRRPGERLASCAYMPQRDLLLPWLLGDRQRRARARATGGASRARRARARAAALRALRAGRVRATPRRASSRAACASASPSSARCWPGKPVLLLDEPFAVARRDHPRRDAGVAAPERCSPSRAPSCSSPTTSRRRSTSATGWWCSRRGPAGSWRAASSTRRARARPRGERSRARGLRRAPRSGRCGRSGGARDEGPDAPARLALPLLVVGLLGDLAARRRLGLLADALGLDRSSFPRRARSRESLWDDRELLADNAWVTLQEVLLGFAHRARRSASAFAIALHLSDTLRRRASTRSLVASQTIPMIAIAPILVDLVRLRDRPQAGDHRADLLLPDHRQHARRAALASTREPRKMMRTLDASRAQTSCAGSRCPSALPVPVQRRQDRRRGGA